MGYQKLTPIIAKGATEPRYLEDRFADVINVKDFGAVDNGIADNTLVINTAIANASVSGKSVYIPAKCKYVRSSLVNTGNVLIIDDSRGSRVTNRDFWWHPGPTRRRWYAHRGYSACYPENTMLAFSGAIDAGCFGIETDVQWTSDGYPICLHDATVDRTTNGTGRADSMTYSQISALRADYRSGTAYGSGCFQELRIPLFVDFLDICRENGIAPLIELKTDSSPTAEQIALIVGLVQDYNMEDIATFVSFSMDLIAAVRNTSKRCGIMFNASVFNTDDIATLTALGGRLYYAMLTSGMDHEKIKLFRANGIDVTSWLASSYDSYRACITMGCTTFCGNAPYDGGAAWL